MPKLIIFNQQISGLVTEIEHTDGIKYLVAPTVAIVEGVMNETLYLGEEINAYIDAWNGKPLIIEHPQDNEGEFVSANQPELLKETLGFYFNAVYEGNKLKGEWWINVEKANKSVVGKQVLKALKEGKILEQSTGLFTDIEEKSGEFNGVHYENIARNIRPDHVAILLHDRGACSVKEGCGTPITNSQDNDNTVIFELKTIREALKTYSKTLTDFVTNFRGNDDNGLEENVMDRETLIEWILENSPIPFTREMLELADDTQLAQIGEAIAPPTEPSTLEEVEPETNEGEGGAIFTPTIPIDSPVSPDTPPSDTGGSGNLLPKEVTDFMKTLQDFGGNAGIKKLIEDIQAKHAAEYDGLLSMLVANSSYSKEDLEKLPNEFLRKMEANITQENEIQTPIYGNRSLGINMSQPSSEWEVYGGKEEVN